MQSFGCLLHNGTEPVCRCPLSNQPCPSPLAGCSSAALTTEDEASDIFEDEAAAFSLLESMGQQDGGALEPYMLIRRVLRVLYNRT